MNDSLETVIIPKGTQMNIWGVPFVTQEDTPFDGRKKDLEFVRRCASEYFQDIETSEILATNNKLLNFLRSITPKSEFLAAFIWALIAAGTLASVVVCPTYMWLGLVLTILSFPILAVVLCPDE